VEFGLSSTSLRQQRPSGPAANLIIIDGQLRSVSTETDPGAEWRMLALDR
jgi:hypothetical protein